MNRRGFSLVEITAVIVIAGILANIAVPTLHTVRRHAEAARVVGDYNSIRLAAYDYYAGNGTFPGNGSWGQVPPALVPSLPQGFTFQYNTVTYRWRRWALPSGMPRNKNQTVLLGLDVRTTDQELMRAINATFRGGKAFGTSTQVTLVIE